MTSVLRPYINPKYEQEVDDGCLQYKSIPMAVVKDVIKVTHAKNDFDGIKQIYNKVPPRPKDINTMATSIARINNLPYNTAVPEISKRFINEETTDVNKFVNTRAISNGVGMPSFPQQGYVQEHASQSSTGVPLAPSVANNVMFRTYPENLRNIAASFVLGDVEPSRGIIPYNPSIEVQTDWVTNRQSMSQGYVVQKLEYGNVSFEKYNFERDPTNPDETGIGSQTIISKPPTGFYITKAQVNSGMYTARKNKTEFFSMPASDNNEFRANVAYPTSSREPKF